MTVAIAYPHRLAGHCASGAFRDLFEYRGYRHRGAAVSEAMVFGLASGLDVIYIPDPAPRVPFYLGGRGAELEESLLARVGGALERHAEPDDDAAWAELRARLDAGEPVALVADCQKLDYLRTRTSMPLHVVVVVGYDATHVLVADNDRDAIQRCALDSLREARRARGFPMPAMNVTFRVRWPDALPPLATLVRPAIAQAVAVMREPGGIGVRLFGPEAFGLAALARLEHDAATWNATGRDAAVPAMLLWIATEKGGTGGGFFRRLWRDFLVEAHALAPSPALAAARDHYAAVADGWSEVGALAAAGSFAGVPTRVVALARAEREGVALLARVADDEADAVTATENDHDA
jgi:hypothetical protein